MISNLLAKLKSKSLLLAILVISCSLEIIFGELAFSQGSGGQEKSVKEKIAQVKTSEGNKENKEKEDKDNVSSVSPVLEIKRLKTKKRLYSIELKDVDLADFFRVVAHDYKLNFLVDKKVKGKVTASFTNISLEEALERIAQMNNLALKKKENVIIVKPDLVTKMFILRHIEADKLLGISKEKQNQAKQGGAKQGDAQNGAATIYDLLSPDGKLLLGPQANSIVVIDYPPNVERVKNFVMAVDQKMMREVFKLRYLSVKYLFPDLVNEEMDKREKQRDERQKESDEIKNIRETTSSSSNQ